MILSIAMWMMWKGRQNPYKRNLFRDMFCTKAQGLFSEE